MIYLYREIFVISQQILRLLSHIGTDCATIVAVRELAARLAEDTATRIFTTSRPNLNKMENVVMKSISMKLHLME